MNRLLPYIKIARFDHWIKQLFVLPGAFFAYFLINPSGDDMSVIVFRALLGFAATCITASANYIINEWLDAGYDAFHPQKKERPLVTADINKYIIMAEYAVFLIAGLSLAFIASKIIFIFEAALLVMGVVYNVPPMRTKEIPILDVLTESINNALRFLIGWFMITAVHSPPVSIVFGYWMGGAFLMAAKRLAEYRMIDDAVAAGRYRKSFKYYNEKRLLLCCFFYAMMSLFFCGIFLIKYKVELIFAIPVLCGLFCIYLNISYREDSSAQKPEKPYREKPLMFYTLFLIVIVLVLMNVRIPFMEHFEQHFLNAPAIGGFLES
ncbi:MAG: UbiA prenyltransferase family protein [Spirochaetaceae bacterium]|nr:UbiA prenyltransferase family protein [Spirochaetaceae bacterium]